MSAGLRIDYKFPYKSLWIVMETHLENPDLTLLDTINYTVSDEKGIPLGFGITKKQQERPVRTVNLHKGQYGEVRFYHIMTREEIPGISEIGLALKSVTSSVDPKKNK